MIQNLKNNLYLSFFILIFLIFFPIKKTQAQNNNQNVKVVKLKNVLDEMQKNTADTTLVLNFWATWCVPCVKELPDFMKLATEKNDEKSISNDKITPKKFIFIAVEDDLKKVISFLEKKKFFTQNIHKNKIEFWLLDEKDGNTWISPIEKTWDGAIPFTLILKNKHKKLHFGEIHYEELKKEVNHK